MRVAVAGRRGVGRRTVAHALARAGIAVTPPQGDADLEVYVIAEVIKPEDRDAIAATRRPVLTVLNKADLSGKPAGVLGEPMVALLAVAALDDLLDDTRWAALRALAARPADLSSPDSFLAGVHPLPAEIRRQLLDTFDLFGIRRAIAAIGRGDAQGQVHALLRRLSRIDAVAAAITAAGAQVRYQRTLGAVAELEALAVTDRRAAEFLTRDDTVIARMAAAADVVEAAGLPVQRCHDRPALLRRAVHWQRYSRGPASAVHRSCGRDIARGSLRIWSQSGGDRKLGVAECSGAAPISRGSS
ncbi:MAG: hypothetical protein ACRDTV_14770 [Mycobacterium sp.]